MDVLEAIAGRRSVKKFADTRVEDEKLRKIAQAALWAPSGQNLQPLRLWMIRDRERIAKIEGEVYRFGLKLKRLRPLIQLFAGDLRGAKGKRVFKSLKEQLFNGAPVLVMTGADPKESTTSRIDCTLAAQNIQLAAHGLGLGSCYVGWAKLAGRLPALRRELKIPPGVEIVDGVVIGYPAGPRGAPKRKELDEVTTWL